MYQSLLTAMGTTSGCLLVSIRPMPSTLSPCHVYGVIYHLLISLKILSTSIPLYDFVGCLEDTASNGQPLLYGPTAKKETQESCKVFCTISSGGPYRYFGIKDGSDCHCGNTFLHSAVNRPGECNTGCSGNATQQCGGTINRISLWETSDWPPVRVFSYKLAEPSSIVGSFLVSTQSEVLTKIYICVLIGLLPRFQILVT